MATYKVGSEGHKYMQVGDLIVTEGGTYRYNGEGQQSTKVSDTNTSNYSGKYDTVDFTNNLNNLMNNGASASEVAKQISGMEQKLSKNPNLVADTNQDALQRAYAYLDSVNNQKGYDPTQDPEYQAAMEMLKQAQQNQPTYNNPYSGQLTDLYNQIVNRDAFSYDVNEDMLYKQYANQYALGGRTAMEDTAGQTASLTGGYGSSYGSVASQQQYDRYMQELNNIIPTLADQSYQKYLNEGNDLYNQYNLLNQQATTDYNQYMDRYNQWLNNLNYAAGAVDSAYNRGYNNYASGVDQSNADREYNLALDKWNYQKAQDAASSSKTGSNKTPYKEETPASTVEGYNLGELLEAAAGGASRADIEEALKARGVDITDPAVQADIKYALSR